MTEGSVEPLGRSRAILVFVLLALVWGSTWLVIKGQLASVPPSWSVTWRFVLGAAGMAGLALIRRETLRLDRAGLRLAALLGVLQFCVNFQFVYRAEHYVPSGLVAVIYALLLVPNTVLAWLFLGAKISRRFVAGSVVAIAGIGLLFLHEYRTEPVGGAVFAGLALTLGAVLCASSANVVLASAAARRQTAVPLLAWAMLCGATLDAAWSWITAGPPQFAWTAPYMMATAYLALVGSVLTFPFYFALIRDWGPGKAAYNGVAVPVVAMALSTLFEGYRWTALAAAGASLAMAGLLIALSDRQERS